MQKIVFLFLLLGTSWLPLLGQRDQLTNRMKITIATDQVQSSNPDPSSEGRSKSARRVSTLKPLRVKFADPVEDFFTLALNWPKSPAGGPSFSLEYREKKRNKWSAWKPLPIDRHGEEESSVEATEMRQLDARVRSIQLRIFHEQELPRDLQLNLFNPLLPAQSATDPAPWRSDLGAERRLACPCPLPQLVDRSTWGAPRPCAAPGYAAVTHLVVHHSAGVNTSNNWARIVLSIWDFHVNTRAYCDVAYNYLIDPNGVLYEGRSGGNNVIGAHFCATNTGTMGVCLLGNFQEVEPTDAMLNTLANLLAWKSCDANVDPLQKSVHARSNLELNHICGHRDGCATECPGNNVYNKLASVRNKVVSNIQACKFTVGVDDVKPETYRVEVIPNPAHGSFRLQTDPGVRITHLELYNLMGQRMSEVQYDALTLQVKCRNLPQGVYVLRVLDDRNRMQARQIVLQ